MKTALTILVLSATLAGAEPLPEVLAHMDRAAADFRSLSAHMKRVQFTAVLSESSEMEGELRLRRTKAGTQGIVEFQQPEQRTVFINGKQVQIYYPKANSVEIYDASKYSSNMDQILLLGFGTSAAELKKSYDIKDGGAQKIAGVDATRIELTPRAEEMKKLITKIELWIPDGQSNPIRAKFSEPSKNYELVDYSDIKVNPPLPDSAFAWKLPGNVKKIYPQK
ncbi:MAG: outer-membrane lipoprotein carrier protein LolA [Acidobacteriota bacterium]